MSTVKTKLYRYTRLRTDGTSEIICLRDTPMDFERLASELGILRIQLIPPEYYEGKGWGHCTVYGDDEGRVPGYIKNIHFHEPWPGWDVPGDCIRVDKVDAP